MELVIGNNVRNELLNRDEISAIAQSEITPKTSELKVALAEKLSKDGKLVVVKEVKGKFGSKDFLVKACVYDNFEALEKLEPLQKEKKEKPVAQPKTEEGEKEAEKEEKQEVKENDKESENKEEAKPAAEAGEAKEAGDAKETKEAE